MPATYLINPLPAGGFPLENEDLLNLQDVQRVALNQVLKGLGSFYVVNGCNTTSSDAGTMTATVSAGYVFLDGEVRYFAGYTGTYPFFVVTDTATITQKVYADGNSKDTYQSLVAKSVANKPANTEAITFSPSAVERIATSITGALTTALNNLTTTVSNLSTTINTAIDTKVTRRFERVAWTNFTYTGSEPEYTPTTSNTLNVPQFCKTEDGFVHFRGTLNVGTYYATPFAELPASCRPIKWVKYAYLKQPDKAFNITILPDGAILGEFVTNNGAFVTGEIDLDGFQFYAGAD